MLQVHVFANNLALHALGTKLQVFMDLGSTQLQINLIKVAGQTLGSLFQCVHERV